MRIPPARTAMIAASFAVAFAAALVLLQSGTGSDGRGAGDRQPMRGGGGSDIWKVGDRWTVKVRQDAGAITPDGATSIASVPFRFRVVDAPAGASGTWKVRVTQDGAEGPFAAGWQLHYRAKGGAMVLHRVAIGTEPPLEAELAAIVLGPQFPYETRYAKPPRDRTLDAAKLLERSTLPPSSLPADRAGAPSALPPANAPELAPGETPVGAPTR